MAKTILEALTPWTAWFCPQQCEPYIFICQMCAGATRSGIPESHLSDVAFLLGMPCYGET